jgi:hypothetical protein
MIFISNLILIYLCGSVFVLIMARVSSGKHFFTKFNGLSDEQVNLYVKETMQLPSSVRYIPAGTYGYISSRKGNSYVRPNPEKTKELKRHVRGAEDILIPFSHDSSYKFPNKVSHGSLIYWNKKSKSIRYFDTNFLSDMGNKELTAYRRVSKKIQAFLRDLGLDVSGGISPFKVPNLMPYVNYISSYLYLHALCKLPAFACLLEWRMDAPFGLCMCANRYQARRMYSSIRTKTYL